MQDEEKVFGIVDPLSTCYDNMLFGQFVGGKIAVNAYRPITCSTVDKPTDYANKHPVAIQILKRKFIYDDPILRSLIAETSSTFVTVQSLSRSGSKSDYLKISRTYRSIIRACLEKLQNAAIAAVENCDEACLQYQQHISTFYSIECLWHLSEILYLDPTPTRIVAPQLLTWIRFHFPTAERMATELLLLGREACDHDDYWPAVEGLIIQGQVEVARVMLQLHPMADGSAFKIAENILKTMPIYQTYSGHSIQKFRTQWQYWVADSIRKLATNIFSTEPQLETIVKLVTANTKTWEKYIESSEYWYEHFPGYLSYTNPTTKYVDLGEAANSWLQRWANLRKNNGAQVELRTLDKVILSLLNNNMNEVLSAAQQMPDNQWFATHLTDLLYNCKELQIMGDHQVDESVLLRNSLVFEYGSSLMLTNSLWQLGMDYLVSCPEEGMPALENLLSKIPLHTERHALKIMGIAKRKGFTQIATSICKILSMKSFHSNQYGNALEWAIRSKNTRYITAIADFVLKNYVNTGQIICQDVITNIGSKMLVSPRLVFLVKYYDFHILYRNNELAPAAELLVNLLDSKITPEYFWPTLLIDTIPFLECKEPKLKSKETCAILQHLEAKVMPIIIKRKNHSARVSINNTTLNTINDAHLEDLTTITTRLRLACAQNLAQTFVLETTAKH